MKNTETESDHKITSQGDPSISYENRFMKITTSPVRFPNGAEGNYSVITSGTGLGSIIIPVTRFRGLTYIGLVEQYRWPVRETTLEFPRGGADPNEDALDTSYREMLEETGIPSSSVGSIVSSGSIYPDTGILDTVVHIHIAMIRDLELHKSFTEDETGARFQWMKLPEFHGNIASGKIKCSMSIAAFTMAQVFNPNIFLDAI